MLEPTRVRDMLTAGAGMDAGLGRRRIRGHAVETLRLLKSYRGYRPGMVIRATPKLAETLRAEGIAATEPQQSFLPADGAERAVADKQHERR